MTIEEKLEKLAVIFEVEPGELDGSVALGDLAWDSMAMLSFIAIVSEEFGKKVTGTDLKDCATVGDLLRIME